MAIGGGRIDLLSRSEHYLGPDPVCALELEADETDPTPMRIRGTTGDGIDFDLQLPIPRLVIQRPMSFTRCEHALLIDPDPLLAEIAATGGREEAAQIVGAEVPGALWFGSRAQADRAFETRWPLLAPPTAELDADQCGALAADTGGPDTGGQAGGGAGCATGPQDPAPLSGDVPRGLGLLVGLAALAGRRRRC